MIDRPSNGLSNSANDPRLRYIRRSSVYSRRTLDGIVPQPAPITKEPLASPVFVSDHKQNIPKTAEPAVLTSGPRAIDILPVRKIKKVPTLPRQQYRQQITEPALEQQVYQDERKRSLKRRLFTRNNALVGMAIMVFLFGVTVSVNSLLTNKHVTKQVQALSNDTKSAGDEGGTSGDQKPDETPLHPSAVSGYKVAPDLPRKITIQKIGVAARIKPLGVSRDNQLLAPSNIYDAGWYNASAKPGVDAGAVLIDGHVHGPTKPGIFVNLKKLTAGDLIDVERGDGRIVHYKVEKVQSAPADKLDMGTLLTSVKPGRQGLNLVTCGGKYDAQSGHYIDRDMVFAVQVD